MSSPTYDDHAIREGLATNLQPLGIRVSPYALNNPPAPIAYVKAGNIDYGRGLTELYYGIVVLVAYNAGEEVDVAAQQVLAGYRDSSGVKGLLEANPNLSGACDDLEVLSASEPTLFVAGDGRTMLGCEFTVKVIR